MKNKCCWSPSGLAAVNKSLVFLIGIVALLVATGEPLSAGTDAPPWMHALVNAPLPPHDENTDAVLLYSEKNITVVSADKIRIVVRRAYKILRPGGRDLGTVVVFLNSNRKVTSLHGWCIPAQGKDYAIGDKEAMEVSPPKIAGSELIADVKAKIIHIPAPDPGNLIGYEYEVQEHPLVLQQTWEFQGENPVRESRFSLQLPAGWEYKAAWLNYPEMNPTQVGASQWQWLVGNVKEIRKEEKMPPMDGLAGQMIVSFFPPGDPATKGFSNWRQMGDWYRGLTADRLKASPEIEAEVKELTAGLPSQLEKMQALASFVQHDIRYVAIELGIGGWQPHPAAEIFTHRYGDCKDKATLLSSMLQEIGVDSYYVIINSERGSVSAATPAHNAFDHAILAIRLPETLTDPSLTATVQHPTLGRLLFFDPTSELIPFGHIGGYLQANWGLLVSPSGGELIELPQQPPTMSGIHRVAQLTLNANGTLQGQVQEIRLGDQALFQRRALRYVTNDADRIKPIENLLSGSLSNFRIIKASLMNLQPTDRPFIVTYTFEADGYAKMVGNLLLVRPRVIGVKSSGILETKEPRQFPVEFDGPAMDRDNFEITIPAGFVVDDLPPPVDVDFNFASYHSKTEANNNIITYTRTFEVKELSVPVSKAEELKKFYRIVASDERNTAVLKPAQ